jgi:putative ABC transport system permease protein
MTRTLIFISLRDWRNHKLRVAITIIGVAIGVSAYFALRTVNQSLLRSLEATVDRLAGRATLQITAGESGFPEDVIEAVRTTVGVTDAVGQILEFCKTELNDKAYLLVMGVDPEAEQNLRVYDDSSQENQEAREPKQRAALFFLKAPGAVVISSVFAEKENLKAGDRIPILTPSGRTELRVLHVLKDDRVDKLYGGRVGIMDIHTAQNAFGRGRNIDRIDLITEHGIEIESVRQGLKQRLPAGLEVERPQQRSQRVEDATIIVRQGFLVTSLMALLISCFLIFNAMSIAVNQRWKETGVLRALGVERRNIRRMFLYDAILIAVLGSGLGVLTGYYIAVAFAKLTGGLLPIVSAAMPSSTLPLIAAPTPPTFNAGFAVESVALGIVAVLISAWLPARAASKLNPILALHNIETRQREAVVGWPRLALGASLVIAGLAFVRFTTPLVGVILQLGYFVIIFLGLIIMLPRVSGWIASAIRPVAGQLFGTEGLLAIDSIRLAPRRTSATVGALMVVVAFVFSIWGFIQSEKEVLSSSYERTVSGDLQVFGAALMSEASIEPISAIRGIANVDRNLFTSTRYQDRMVAVIASDMNVWFSRSQNVLAAGDYEKARALVPAGKGVLISDILAARSRLRVGDALTLETPSANLERPVLGILDSKAMAWLEGVVYMDRELYREFWQDSRISWLSIDLEPNADVAAVRTEIERAASGRQPLFVETSDEIRHRGRETISTNIDQFFTFFYVQMFIATFVAVIGLINTLVISVWDRKREMGIIRAVGGTRGQIAKIVIIEAGAIGVIGLVTGVVKGALDIYFMSRTAAGIFGGYSIPFYFSAKLLALSIPIVMIVALAAAWWPARLATRTNVIAAIGSE